MTNKRLVLLANKKTRCYLSVSLFLGEVLVWELGSISLELPCWVRAASLARCICCLKDKTTMRGDYGEY